MSDEVLLSVESVSKRFHRVVAVDGVRLTVRRGELLGLIGPNGAGKSTTLSMCCGDLLPDTGRILIAGHDVADDPLAARRAFGYVPQRLRLFPFLTGAELLALVAEVKGLPTAEGRAQADALLAQLALAEARDRLTREYSEGMARKLSLAVALLGRPPLLVLDESLNGLDPRAAAELKSMLRAHCEQGGAVVIAGHVLETMERLCSRVVLLHRGRVVGDLDRAALDALAAAGRTLEDHYLATPADEPAAAG